MVDQLVIVGCSNGDVVIGGIKVGINDYCVLFFFCEGIFVGIIWLYDDFDIFNFVIIERLVYGQGKYQGLFCIDESKCFVGCIVVVYF